MSNPAASRPAGFPQPDHDTVLLVLQDQLDELLAVTRAQQETLDMLLARVSELEQRHSPQPGEP